MRRLAGILVAVFASAGCGPGGNLDVCHADCSAKRRCGPGFTDSDEAACHDACAQKPGCYSDQDHDENRMCRNASDLRQQKLDCYSRACGEISACVQPLVAINQQNPLCQKQ